MVRFIYLAKFSKSMDYKTLLKNQLSQLEKKLDEFPEDWNSYNPKEFLDKGRSIIILQSELERGLGIYKKINWDERKMSYDPETDPIVQKFEEIKLKIADNEILESIKENDDPYYVTQRLAKEILKKSISSTEPQPKQTSKKDKFNPMYG